MSQHPPIELYPFKRALIAHKREATDRQLPQSSIIMSADHIAAITQLAESKLDYYGIPDDIRCGARFVYHTGPLEYQTTIVSVVSEVSMIRDQEKWALQGLSLTSVPRRMYYHGHLQLNDRQNEYLKELLHRRFSANL